MLRVPWIHGFCAGSRFGGRSALTVLLAERSYSISNACRFLFATHPGHAYRYHLFVAPGVSINGLGGAAGIAVAPAPPGFWPVRFVHDRRIYLVSGYCGRVFLPVVPAR